MNSTTINRQRGLTLVVLLGLLFATPTWADTDHGHGDEGPLVEPQAQTECPVMVGNAIDPDIYTVYQGKKVFFCCQLCKTEFEKNPDNYLPRLPQFASVTTHEHDAGGSASVRTFLARLIVPMGILTLSLVAMTVALAALRRWWKPRVMIKIHKKCGVAALIAGALHATLVMFLH